MDDYTWTSFKIDKGFVLFDINKIWQFSRVELMSVERQADWHLSIAGLSVGGEPGRHGSC